MGRWRDIRITASTSPSRVPRAMLATVRRSVISRPLRIDWVVK
jgi:hypothetical protein